MKRMSVNNELDVSNEVDDGNCKLCHNGWWIGCHLTVDWMIVMNWMILDMNWIIITTELDDNGFKLDHN